MIVIFVLNVIEHVNELAIYVNLIFILFHRRFRRLELRTLLLTLEGTGNRISCKCEFRRDPCEDISVLLRHVQ